MYGDTVHTVYTSRIIFCEYQRKNGERFGESINNKIENDNNKILINH